MSQSHRALAPLLIAAFLLLSGNGLLATSLAIRVSQPEFANWATGVVSAFAIGLLIGAFIAPKFLRKVGHIRTFSALCGVITIATLAMEVFPHPAVWILSRMIGGICAGGSYVVLESWLTAVSPPSRRGQTLAIYLALCHLGLAFGQTLVSSDNDASSHQDMIAAALYVAALIPLALTSSAQPQVSSNQRTSWLTVLKTAPVGISASAISGLATGAWTYAGGLFLKTILGPDAPIGTLMSSLFIGGLALQWPIGWLADRMDRRRVLQLLGLLIAGIHLLFLLLINQPFLEIALPFTLFLVGSLVFVIYPVALAHTQDLAPQDQLTGFSSSLLLAYGAGTILGPAGIAPLIQWGPATFLLVLSAVGALLFLTAGTRIAVRPDLDIDEQVSFQPMLSPYAAPGHELDPRTDAEQLELPFFTDTYSVMEEDRSSLLDAPAG